MVVLVTGAAGWLGPRLVRQLSSAGEQVRALVHSTTSPATLRLMRRFTPEVIVGDVRDEVCLKDALRDVHSVFHLAAVSAARHTRELYDINVRGTENLLRCSLAGHVERFIHVSSIAAAGKNALPDRPMTEWDMPGPISEYGKSRLLAEQRVNLAHEGSGLRTTILRPCWIYGPGPGISPRMLKLVRLIAQGRAPIFANGGNQTSMTYVRHMVAASMLAYRSEKAVGQTYFIADARPYAMAEVYRAIARALGVPFRPIQIPSAFSRGCASLHKSGEMLGLNMTPFRLMGELGDTISCSIDKARDELCFRPGKTLASGMAELVRWAQMHGELSC